MNMSKVEFPSDEIHRISDEWELFFKGELNKPMIYFGSIYNHFDDPLLKKRKNTLIEYPADMSAEEIIEIEDVFLGCKAYIGDTYPCFALNCGPGSLSAYLGARMEIKDSIWFFPTAENLEDIPERIHTECLCYRRIHEVLTAAKEAWSSVPVQIITSDMGNNLDVLSALRDPAMLGMDILDQPELLKQKLAAVTAAWIQSYHAEYEKISAFSDYTAGALGVLSKGKTARLQSDFAYMISPDMYEEFVLPDIKTLAEYLDDPCYHLDGIPQLNHLTRLLRVEKIRAVEFVAGAGKKPACEWTDVFKRLHSAGKQCLQFISVKDALDLKEAMGGSLRGFGLFIGEYMPREEAENLYRNLIS